MSTLVLGAMLDLMTLIIHLQIFLTKLSKITINMVKLQSM